MEAAKLSHTAALILQTISSGYNYGFDIMEVTGLPSGTVYPALRRLEHENLVRGKMQSDIAVSQGPPRKLYKITEQGKHTLLAAQRRYPLLARMTPAAKEKPEKSAQTTRR